MSTLPSAVHVLVADDQPDILRSAQLLFKSEGIACTTCETPKAVLSQLKKQHFDIVLLDLNYQKDTTSGTEGLELIQAIRKEHDTLPIVVMTAWATIDIAVNTMKVGASDFISKPWDVERLLSIVKTQVALSRALLRQNQLEGENRVLRADNKSDLIFASAAMQNIRQSFEQISASDACVLITGENGTGKTQLARLCHDLSHRANKPFIAVNMGALSASVFESEIFGHEKGAFTGANSQRIGRFELADGGTLFLDEIANLPEKQQATLLRLLESGEFERVGSSTTRRANVRIICATNDNLLQAVANGKFRQDLYYRIATVPVQIPPLRERTEDISLLADFFLEKFGKKYHKSDLQIHETARSLMANYAWPGNVRELQHCMERAALLTNTTMIEAMQLGLTENVAQVPSNPSKACHFDGLTLAEVEYHMLDAALIKYLRKPDQAAKALGISRSALYRKLAKHGFDMS